MSTEKISLESYMSQLRFAAALFDLQHRLVVCSPKFETLFLINTVAEQRRKPQGAVSLPNNQKLVELIGSVYTSHNRLSLPELRVVTATGERTLSVDIFPIYSDDQTFWGVSVHLWDARERSIFVEQKTRSENLLGLAAIASGLAHEIKNPLSGIRGAAQLLLADKSSSEVPASEKFSRYLEIIIAEADRMDRLVKDLLHLTKPRELKSTPVNINRVLHETVMMVQAASSSQIRWKESYDPSLPELMADEDALRQIFMNLTKNAVDAVGEVGQVRLSSQIMSDLAIRTGDRRQQIIRVTVEDTGAGIPEDQADKIFAPFYSTKLKGTGLGLAIVNQLVELHRGSVIVKSVPGEGTVFSVFLPL